MPGHTPDQPGPQPSPPPLPQLEELTFLAGQAAFLHETYTSFQEAGFSEDRAFQLLLALVFHSTDDLP